MNVRDYMHDIHYQNANTKLSEEGQGEGKRKMSKEEALTEQQNKNKDLTMHMYKVLGSRSKVLDEARRAATLRITNVLQRIMTMAMEREPMFQTYFGNPVTGEGVEMKIELADATRYEMRVYLKSFPFPDSFQMNFGLAHNVPHGCAEVSVNKHMGRVEKMMIKSDWGNLMDGDCLTPVKIIPWFSEGLIKAVRNIQMDDADPDHNKISIDHSETGVQLTIITEPEEKQKKDSKSKSGKKMSITSLQDTRPTSGGKTSVVTVTCIVSVRGTGMPRGMRLQHALPNREPYSTQGKQVVDDMADEITEGRSLYTLDACVETDEESGTPSIGFWETNFKLMTERVMNSARMFGKTNMIDPAIHVIEMISISRHWDIPTTIIETAALWEYKKSANKLRNEAMCFKNVLNRLHGYFTSQSCPHFLLANYNMLKMEDKTWCEVIAKEIGDAINALDDDPGMLLELTGTNKKKEKKDAVIEEDAVSVRSHHSVKEG